MKRMIIDVNNLFFRTIAAQLANNDIDRTTAGLGLHGCLTGMAKYVRIVNPDEIAVSFEGKMNWRKDYTNSEACVSKRLYKGNRVKDPSMAVLFEVIGEFRELITKYTSLLCIANDRLEGDDCIAAYALEAVQAGDELTILSGDKDFVGLLKLPNVKLLNPAEDKYRTLEEVCGVNDADYFIFEKCFRGDSGDNVMSAYPRVRKTKLQKAFSDDFTRLSLMSHEWEFCDTETGDKRIMKVGELFEENKILMDLIDGQPNDIKELMKVSVQQARQNKGKYNIMQISKFCNKHELMKVLENIGVFAEIFYLNEKKRS